ncbi:hypothetical protein NM688_g4896 [Phlebia brevispora]|uniref:Uncharacterized protein n=1 Tax=Phlebia brevispora TaxID=194682 RepID=A0ACC1T1T0_9APHY|nr:hypothetical protein NM688_g4896 [Phlebia brevispora]
MSVSIGRKTTYLGAPPAATASRIGGTEVEENTSSAIKKLFNEFQSQVKKFEDGIVSAEDILQSLPGLLDAIKHGNAIDDRKMLLEHILVFLSKLKPGALATTLQNAVVELLYNDLPHPPSTYIGPRYAWRAADGSYNNLSDPNMGRADTPYARSVQQMHPLPLDNVPDPGLIFDTLLRRKDFTPHPAGLSSMMFAFAALVIHTVFRTSHDDVSKNETSSYVDLAPLYGTNEETQMKVRALNGTGRLHPDTFAENRLLLLPPAVAVLVILFNRNHNYIADKLLEINERGTYRDPKTLSDLERTAQDKELFETARLINCAWFGSAIFSDYFSAILGLVREGNNWSLNPFGEIRNMDHSLFERGRGNVCSVEFNCLYRWHATTSEPDEKWVHDLIQRLFNKSPDQVTLQDMKEKNAQLKANEPNVEDWTIDNLKRNMAPGPRHGMFNDEDLAGLIYTATENPAHAFGAQSTPGCMRLHEIMGIMQSRAWGVCSLNDFRRFLELKPYASFQEWNENPEVAAAAEKLYGDIERLELYAGLQAEQPKPVVQGAGLCPPYTISRAILADAIALTRGDRFFTADYTSYNLTAWGFADCQRDPNAPGYGSMLGRLFMRTLPHHFAPDSSYTWFPLMTPKAMDKYLGQIGDRQLYNLARPTATSEVPEVHSYRDVGQVLGSNNFSVLYSGRAAHVGLAGDGFFMAPNDPARGQREQRAMLNALTGAPGALDRISNVFYEKTKTLMLSQSWPLVGKRTRNVDIARDVLKYVPLYWASEVAGIKLKSSATAHDGLYTPQELHDMLGEIYTFLFLDFEHWKSMPLAKTVKGYVDELLGHIKANFNRTYRFPFSIFGVVSRMLGGVPSAQDDLMQRFAALGYDNDTLANSILAVLVGATVEMSEGLVNAVNFYIDGNASAQLRTCIAKRKFDAQDQAVIQGFALEALRLDPPFRGVYREALTAEKVGGHMLNKSDHVFVDIATANMDPDVYHNPQSVNPNRMPRERYLVGDGVSKCLGLDVSSRLMGEVLRAVFSFSNVRRVPKSADDVRSKLTSGDLKRYKMDVMRTSKWLYLNKDQHPSPWATSMVVQFE